MPVSPMSAVIARAVSVGVHEDVLPSSTRERYPAARIGRGFIPPLRPGDDPLRVFERIRELARPWKGGGVYVSYKPAPRESAWLRTALDRYATGRKPLDLPPSVYLAWSSVGREGEKVWLLTDDSAVAMRELTDDLAGR